MKTLSTRFIAISILSYTHNILQRNIVASFTLNPHSTQRHNLQSKQSDKNIITPITTSSTTTTTTTLHTFSGNAQEDNSPKYIPPEQSESTESSKPKLPTPKIGDFVKYYDIDGGKVDGQVFVGKISFIQKQVLNDKSNWMVEINELDDVGDGYYIEYSWRERKSKTTLRNLREISPLVASYVRTEDAYKIPTDSNTGLPISAYPSYDVDGYDGPKAIPVNSEIMKEDSKLYGSLKIQLLKDAALYGAVGAVLVDLLKGFNDALVYSVGAIAGVGYLFFLSIKTDTVGSADAKFGNNISNLRFALPLIVLVGISMLNLSSGGIMNAGSDEEAAMKMFHSVSSEQFGAAMLGFLTYRIPLFISQLGPVVGESVGFMLPGSAGIALQLAQDDTSIKKDSSMVDEDLTTVLLISGPAGTGKSDLVNRLIEESDGKFVRPKWMNKITDPVNFEQMEERGEFLQKDGQYGLTKDGILYAIDTSTYEEEEEGEESNEVTQVVVVDADVQLSKALTQLGGIRLVGVWVGLDTLDKFETSLKKEIESGVIPVPADETPESILRANIRTIVKDIEYGVVSGIFEFTILNDDSDKSLKQLKEAAEYCFK